MNRDNITRLALNAGFDVNDYGEWVGDKDGKCLERFAESIIRECANVAFQNSHSWSSVDQAVKDHFGVT